MARVCLVRVLMYVGGSVLGSMAHVWVEVCLVVWRMHGWKCAHACGACEVVHGARAYACGACEVVHGARAHARVCACVRRWTTLKIMLVQVTTNAREMNSVVAQFACECKECIKNLEEEEDEDDTTAATAATAATTTATTFPMQPDSSSSSEGEPSAADEPPSAAQLEQEEEKALADQQRDQEQIEMDLGLRGVAACEESVQQVPATPTPATPGTPATPATPATPPATPGTPPTPVAWNTRAAGGATAERDMVEEFIGNWVDVFGKDITATNHPIHSACLLCKEMRAESDDDERG